MSGNFLKCLCQHMEGGKHGHSSNLHNYLVCFVPIWSGSMHWQ